MWNPAKNLRYYKREDCWDSNNLYRHGAITIALPIIAKAYELPAKMAVLHIVDASELQASVAAICSCSSCSSCSCSFTWCYRRLCLSMAGSQCQ